MMKRLSVMAILLVAFLLMGATGFRSTADRMPTPDRSAVRIDIPVNLRTANAVFNLDHLAFSGDMPVGIKYMHLLAERYKEQNIQGKIIGIFHGQAAYMTLNDRAYNAFRGVTTGNPYKELIATLLKQGVQVEECAVSMRSHHWTNSDLLPGVKVNAGAVIRLIQLVQQGYVQIQP